MALLGLESQPPALEVPVLAHSSSRQPCVACRVSYACQLMALLWLESQPPPLEVHVLALLCTRHRSHASSTKSSSRRTWWVQRVVCAPLCMSPPCIREHCGVLVRWVVGLGG